MSFRTLSSLTLKRFASEANDSLHVSARPAATLFVTSGKEFGNQRQHRRPDLGRSVLEPRSSLVHHIKPPSDLTLFDQWVPCPFLERPATVALCRRDGSEARDCAGGCSGYEGNWSSKSGPRRRMTLDRDGARARQKEAERRIWQASGSITWRRCRLNC